MHSSNELPPPHISGYTGLAMLIAGRWTQGSSGATEPVIDPATEGVIGHLPHASVADLDAAIAAAQSAFVVWRALPAAERSRRLEHGIEILRSRTEQIARILTMENGKPLEEARIEVYMACEMMKWNAEEGRRVYGRILQPNVPGMRQQVLKEPIGVVAAFTPWNMPAVTPARKISGALAAGCSLIIKPSEETPGTCIAMVRALMEGGLPEGLINVVFGVPHEVSNHLIHSRRVNKVTFTGSTAVGRKLSAAAGGELIKFTMELGGHAPFIVADDFDPEQAAQLAAIGKFRNSGQVCVSPTRFLVQRGVYQAFVDALTTRAAALKVGSGLDEAVQMGPMLNGRRVVVLEELVADAVNRGATLTTGGRRGPQPRGFFFEPTVICGVPSDARLMNDEPFGPVAIVNPFDTLDEAIAEANRLDYGLAAYAFSSSTATTLDFAQRLHTGMLAINNLMVGVPESPWGGVKDSGIGAEGGIEGVDGYTVTKYIAEVGAGRSPLQWTNFQK